jgi:hypothetical protein
MPEDTGTGGEAKEKMAALRIARRTKADGAKGAVAKVVGVFLVSLNIGAERQADVFVLGQIATDKEETWGIDIQEAIWIR